LHIQNTVASREEEQRGFQQSSPTMLLFLLRRVVFRSFRPPDRKFGGFCGAVDVRARFRGNVANALRKEITRQFDFGIFAGLRPVSHFEWNWIHDSRSDGATRLRAMVFIVGRSLRIIDPTATITRLCIRLLPFV